MDNGGWAFTLPPSIIYPISALATDQAKRFASEISRSDKLTNRFIRERFGIAEQNAATASKMLNEAVETAEVVIEDTKVGTRSRSGRLSFCTGRKLKGIMLNLFDGCLMDSGV